jgi:hypothetical protein
MGTIKIQLSSLIVTCLLLVGNTNCQAQFINMGIKAGVTSSDVFTPGNNPTLGLTAGLMTELKFIKWMRLRTEANLLVTGTQEHFYAKNDPTYYTLGVPVIIQFMPIKNLHIGGGAEIDYLIATQGGNMPNNRFNLGVLGHVEYRLFDRLGIGLRYVHNLGGFNQFQNIGNSTQNGIEAPFKTSSLQATLSYSFGKKKRCN